MEVLDRQSCLYPELLQHIPSPPTQLWLEGALPSPNTKLLAVVGSRALTSYGRHACESLIAGLEGYDVSIVSGLAFGADACAHRAAMRAGLHTIAIPGSGLSPDALYPKSHYGLAHDILSTGGALLSEHEPEHRAYPHDFPSRNRIMVGMAHAVLMIEAGERSGTLITARMAGDYGRHLLCVPHRIGDANGFGSHIFLRIGATVVTESEHILEALHLEPRTPDTPRQLPLDLSEHELLLLSLLTEQHSRDELIRSSTLPPHQVLSLLSTLELKGLCTGELGLWKRI
jgi:DNA processing protein